VNGFPATIYILQPIMNNTLTNVLTFGTFDLFHVGHLRLLRRAKELGDRLVVGVVSDELCLKKKKNVVIRCEQRVEIVRELKCVDEVFIQRTYRQKKQAIDAYSASILVVGDDWQGSRKFHRLEG